MPLLTCALLRLGPTGGEAHREPPLSERATPRARPRAAPVSDDLPGSRSPREAESSEPERRTSDTTSRLVT